MRMTAMEAMGTDYDRIIEERQKEAEFFSNCIARQDYEAALNHRYFYLNRTELLARASIAVLQDIRKELIELRKK